MICFILLTYCYYYFCFHWCAEASHLLQRNARTIEGPEWKWEQSKVIFFSFYLHQKSIHFCDVISLFWVPNWQSFWLSCLSNLCVVLGGFLSLKKTSRAYPASRFVFFLLLLYILLVWSPCVFLKYAAI